MVDDQIERLVAVEQIRQLVAQYAVAVDSRDLDSLVDLFVDDVQVGRDLTGREALRSSFDESLRGIGMSILNVGTHTIDLDDDHHATGVVYCKGEIQDGDRWIHQAIVYFDTYERRDGRWYFVRRLHELFYGAEVGVSPLELGPADWPTHHVGRGTRPERWDTWRHFWNEPRQICQGDNGKNVWVDERQRHNLRELLRTADRLDSLAETADLMGDVDGAARLREIASRWRLRGMHLLDE